MNQELFFAWLGRLGRHVSLTLWRNTLLLIDNCSAHGSQDVFTSSQYVEVYFLPPNTTRKIQPLDAGTISAIKSKFRRRLLFKVFENINEGYKSIYNVDILIAVRWLKGEWKEMSAECI